MLNYGWKRLFSGLLALVLVVGMLPPVTVAAEETETTETTEVVAVSGTEPAITEPVITEPAATEPVETTMATEAVTEPVETTAATEETVPETTAEMVAETTEATEPEETVAETTEETEATLPENVAAVQALIDALPDLATVTAEDYDAVQDTYDAYEALTEEEKALIQGAEKFEALFAWFNAQAEALGTIASGKCGDKLTWVLDSSGTLSITGNGAMWAGSDENGNYTRPWNEFIDQINTVIIQDGVTSVGAFAFDSCANLDCVSLPATLTTLGRNCFSRCEKLTSVVIPKGIKEIPISAFWQCYNLASITLLEGITSLGNSAFAGCAITAITLPESLTTIDASAFNGCTKLTEVILPGEVTSLGKWAFSWCSALKTIHIPVSLTTIGEDAFYSCGSLTNIYYGGTKAQWNELVASKIAAENWPANATIHYSKLETARGDCGKHLTWVLDSEGTLTISGTGAMYDYTRNGSLISTDSPFVNLDIRKLVFEEGITHIGECAFVSCTGDWGTVVLPESLQTIGMEAFHRCTALTGTLTIPKNVREIGNGKQPASPFGGNRLKSISVAEGNRYFTMEDGVLYTADKTRLIACPGKRSGNVTFPSNLKTIDGSAFYGCSGLNGGLTFPEGLQTIGMWAFVRCSGLNGGISLPTTLKTINLSAFGSCSGLTGTLTLPSGVSVHRSAFHGCSSLTEVYIPGDVALLGDHLFDSGINIHTIHFDGTEEQWNNLMEKKGNTGYNGPVFGYVPSFNCYGQDFGWGVWEFNYRFWECMGGTLTIGCINGAEGSIPNYSTGNPAPWAQYQFQDLVIEGQVTRIGDYAFQGHTELTNVEFNNRVKSIGTDAFAGCTGLQKVLYHGCKEERDVLPVASGNNSLLNANWTYHFLLITGAQNLGDGLISGQSTQLTAIMKPDGTVQTPSAWILPEEYQQYATLSSTGKITAKNVTEKVMITVWAEVDGYGRGGMSFYILPKAASLTIDQGSALTVDMHESDTLNLTVTTTPEDASNKITWSTSDKKIATVDGNGLVTLLKPGTVTIKATANDGSKKFASMKLTVYYVDSASKLTATAEVPTIGLQPGQTAPLAVKGTKVLDASLLDVVSSDSQIATVEMIEGNWVVTAGEKAGTATITASIHEDPLERKAACKVKVIAMQAEALELSADAEEPAQVEKDTVILDAKNVSNSLYTFTVSAQAMDYDSNWADTANVTWASGNTAIATVTDNKDGTATVTVKKGASGECAITATAKDLSKVSANLWLSVRDYQPRLESTSLNMNLFQSSSVDVALLESYGNAIENVSIDSNFKANWEDSVLTLTAQDGVKKGTYTQTLTVTCTNGESYPYTLKIKVTETAPTVTVKQTGKYNLFYNDGTATLNVTVKGEVVENVTVLEGDFDSEYEESVLTLTANSDAAPGKKVTLEIDVEGYQKPVEKTVTLATVTTAPKLKLSAASSTINTVLSDDHSTEFQILDANGEALDSGDTRVECSDAFGSLDFSGDVVTLTLDDDAKGGTATLNVQKPNWTKPVKLTHKVTVQETLPTLKLGATTLKLNSVFPKLGGETTVTLSQGNLELYDVEIIAKTAGAEDVLNVIFEDGEIVAKITDDSIKTGNYLYTCTGKVLNEESFEEIPLKPVTLKITVSATTPKVKLSSTTFKLNRNLAGEEFISAKATVPAGYKLVRFDGEEENFTYEDGYLTASLTGEADMGGTYTVCPVVIPEGGSDPVTLSGIKVKITTYTAKVTATVTTKGKLDVLNPDSAIICTVKLKNCAGTISDSISLSGQDEDLFDVKVQNGNVILTMSEGIEYATNQTYKVTLNMVACGQDVSVNVSFKVTQSALKLTATPSTLTCYQAIGYGATTLKLTSPATAQIESVTLSTKTTADFQKALGENEMQFDPETGRITFRLAHPGLLIPGKNYTLYLDVTPQG